MKRKITISIVCLLLMSMALVGCSSDTLKYQGHTVLMTAICTNSADTNNNSDNWMSDCWTIYYDGTVEFYSTFSKSGKCNESTTKMALQSIKDLHDFFEDDLLSNSRSEIGNIWEIEYYNETNVLSKEN